MLDAAKEWALATKRKATLEYVLIRDVNDTDTDAKRLRKLMSRLPCKLNLIPFNEIEDSEFRRPELNRIERFRQTGFTRTITSLPSDLARDKTSPLPVANLGQTSVSRGQ